MTECLTVFVELLVFTQHFPKVEIKNIFYNIDFQEHFPELCDCNSPEKEKEVLHFPN